MWDSSLISPPSSHRSIHSSFNPRRSASNASLILIDNGARIIIDQKAWRGEIHDYLKTDNGEREVDLPKNVAKLLVEFIRDREKGLLFCTRKGTQLSQSNILRRHLNPRAQGSRLRESWQPSMPALPQHIPSQLHALPGECSQFLAWLE